jgi:hypothetical protein
MTYGLLPVLEKAERDEIVVRLAYRTVSLEG